MARCWHWLATGLAVILVLSAWAFPAVAGEDSPEQPTASASPEPDAEKSPDPEPTPEKADEPKPDKPKPDPKPTPKPDPKPSPKPDPKPGDEPAPKPDASTPVAVDDTYSVAEGIAEADTPGVLGNDHYIDGARAVLVTSPEAGSVELHADGSFSYAGRPDGPTTSFTYRIATSESASGVATVTLESEDPTEIALSSPLAFGTSATLGTPVSDVYTIPANGNLVVGEPGVLANDTGLDFSTSAELVSGPSHGNVGLNRNGSFIYNHPGTSPLPDQFTYRLVNLPLGEQSDPVSVTLNPAPAPVGANDSYTMLRDGSLLVNVLDNDTGVFTVVSADDPAHGTVEVRPHNIGVIRYTPDPGFTGTDTFQYYSRNYWAPGGATVTVTVNEPGPAPVANDDSYTTEPNTQLSVSTEEGVLANDVNAVGVGGRTDDPDHGTLTFGSDGRFIYTPDRGFTGTDTFTYTAKSSDGQVSGDATVTIAVEEPAADPVAANDSYSVDQATTLDVNSPGVLGNDTVTGPVTDILMLSTPSVGTIVNDHDGGFAYTPPASFSGTVTFTYQIISSTGSSNIATATITVNAVTPAPVAVDDAYTTAAGEQLTIGASDGVLDNDTDATSVSIGEDVDHGILLLSADGGFTYTPESGFTGTDTFTYTATGPGGTSRPATVTITVEEVEDPPVANGDAYALDEDETLAVGAPGVLGNDTGATGARLVSGVDHGRLDLDEDGSFTYTPDDDYNGTDEFVYVATNDIQVGQLGRAAPGGLLLLDSEPTTVTLTVNGVPESDDDDDGSDSDDGDDGDDGDDDEETSGKDEDEGALPDTGSPVGSTDVTAALLLILTGGTLIVATRRRARHAG